MVYIELHQSLLTHRKTLRLARLLSEERVTTVGRLVMLWSWALDNAPDGVIARGDLDIVADVMCWASDPDVLCRMLVEAGFLEDHGETMAIHDWYDYAGRLVEKRRANADRMRAARAQQSQEARAPHVQRTFDARAGARQENSTVPNRTQQHSTGQSEPDHHAGGVGDFDGDVLVAAPCLSVASASEAPDDDDDDAGENDLIDASPSTSMLAPALALSPMRLPIPQPQPQPQPQSKPKAKAKPGPAVLLGPETPAVGLAVQLRDAILASKPDARVPKTLGQLQGWARELDLMLRIDKRAPSAVERVIAYAQSDRFWRSVVLSAGKLREKFDTIELQMQRAWTEGRGDYAHGYGDGSEPGSEHGASVAARASASANRFYRGGGRAGSAHARTSGPRDRSLEPGTPEYYARAEREGRTGTGTRPIPAGTTATTAAG